MSWSIGPARNTGGERSLIVGTPEGQHVWLSSPRSLAGLESDVRTTLHAFVDLPIPEWVINESVCAMRTA